MIAARCQMLGCRPVEEDTVFDLVVEDFEIDGGYCQLQMRATRHKGCDSFRIDWGDGTVEEWADYVVWHNYTKAGCYTVRLGKNVKWWRLWDCYTVTPEPHIYVARPAIYPKCWSDWLESCEGTFCGWNNTYHGGVQGRIIPWGRSIQSVFCCYQFCFDVTGGFPPWTPAITDATGAFDRCTGLSGRVPRWGKNIVKVAQCYCDCPGATGPFPPWPERCTYFASCYKNATGMRGEIPAWPECGETLDSTFEGCVGATGIIPKWPESVKSLSSCYKGCTGLTGAWTDDPALLMPEEKVRYSPDSDYYRCYDVVAGCADAVRSLFWDKNWGGLIPRPTPLAGG
ncbi:MAG: hypothetical protein J5727_05730 [Kiritimatiellae bacterium]|nr:hypothetical protein [Kiritimatiellia bacterium]